MSALTPHWNLADLWEQIADSIPDAPALSHGPIERTWAEFDRRADGVAATLAAKCLGASGLGIS